MTIRTRFAPSPTGPLHLGHAYAAVFAAGLARQANGEFLLRIEDIDQSRARPEWEAGIEADLSWLGLAWRRPVMRQSERLPAYHAALQALWARGLLYPCTCNRRDIAEALRAPQDGPDGPDGPVYPGTCRALPRPQRPPERTHLRLDMRKAVEGIESVSYFEGARLVVTPCDHLVDGIGDVVLSRRDMGTSYHLAVVVDDAAQAITDVTRGEDLAAATAIHVLLQHLLALPTPRYHHHRLIRDDAGKRLAKRDDARALASYRAQGLTPQDILMKIDLQGIEIL